MPGPGHPFSASSDGKAVGSSEPAVGPGAPSAGGAFLHGQREDAMSAGDRLTAIRARRRFVSGVTARLGAESGVRVVGETDFLLSVIDRLSEAMTSGAEGLWRAVHLDGGWQDVEKVHDNLLKSAGVRPESALEHYSVNTKEQNIAFRQAWDTRVDAGKKKAGESETSA